MNVLSVVDMQNDFVSGALGTPEAFDIVPYVVGRVVDGRNRGEEILFTRDTHEEDYLRTQEGKKLPVPHCVRGTEGWEIIPQLREYEGQPIDKPTFGSMELPEAARALCGGEPEEIALCGVVTNICVVSNAVVLHSAFLSSTITVLKDLCGTGDNAMGQKALDLLTGMGYRVV